MRHPIKKPSNGLALLKHQSEEQPMMPHMNFFLEKKRKHEEEFSISTVNSNQSEKASSPKKIKKRLYRQAHTMKEDELDIDESLTE